MTKLFNEFKEFAVKGNMMDMAIGIIIGASFNAVVNALVKKVVLPPIAILSDGVNFEEKRIILKEAVNNAEGKILTDEIAIGYGAFLETLLDFMIVAFTIFVVVKFLNKLKRKAEDHKDATVATPKNIELLTRLNELMEEQNQLLKEKGTEKL
ncbi:MAG: large conductance mechanosensitive channel protein MscL [Desulfobacterales bacterium]|nr:large conductance mechanosensitive channel protein MscL [Flavobacteriaceae bacterium]NNL77334.1 large conductance mechanosensitive channel protein MscL [Desulfobacterales bacterium]